MRRGMKELMTIRQEENTEREIRTAMIRMIGSEEQQKEVYQEREEQEEYMKGWGAWDDITGGELDPKEVRKARMREIGYVDQKKVWEKITRAEAKRRGWKIVKTRWIDVNRRQRTPEHQK